MNTATYQHRRGEIEQYFDRTAAKTWARLTSDAPVGRIRATVRAGRDRMRGTLLSWLPDDLHGRRILDAGCGTGALATEAAQRGAEVVAIDLSPTLVALARERAAARQFAGSVDFRSGDMLDPSLGEFDHVVAMDSLIHYRAHDVVAALSRLAQRTRHSVLFTAAPRTPATLLMLGMGKLFPRSDRSPAIEPASPAELRRLMAADVALSAWHTGRCAHVAGGFYKSQALEWVRS
ncbi:MAG: magnesium protoporphyrin IX methyltransferase [Rubrivivax sp.]|nr:magnesium protoporphyrin IX methyltransferase [Rubrivivax sp.]MDH5339140.1 magnesium protoporphyrin IX methyltransferase [Rubrivivax sp.]